MLAQEDFLAPNMSAESSLQRSSWKAEAIRRGDLKISGPIPITEDVPLNDFEEKEYAAKQAALLQAPPQHSPPEHTERLPDPPTVPPPPSPAVQEEAPQHVSAQKDDPPHPLDSHVELPQSNPPVAMHEPVERHRRSATEPTLHSTPSPFQSIPETPTRSSTKKKRKSGLRNVFRKMFGRRSRDDSLEDEARRAQPSQAQRTSDVSMLRTSSERKPATRRPRISDLEVEEPAPINPLGQHLPFPMNVNAPQEASPPHEYLRFESPARDFTRRRATLPTVLAVPETQSLDGRNKPLETCEERQEGDIPSPQIGIALSTPHQQQQSSLQSKRRSRSAGNLHELAKGRPSVERRRSAEIRYWRNSYASGSVYSTNTRPRTAQTVDTVLSAEGKETMPKPVEPEAEPAAEPSPIYPQPPAVVQQEQEVHQNGQVEAFNFGVFKSDFSDDGDSESPVEPTVDGDQRRLSIEDRVKYLEANMRTLETSVRRLSGRNNRQTIILENAPKGRRSRARSSSAGSQRQASHHSSRSSSHTLQLRQYEYEDDAPAPNSSHLPPLSAVNELPTSKPSHEDVTTAAPQRPATASPTPDAPSITTQLAALHISLQHERNARKLLESHVLKLQRELTELYTLVASKLAASPSYPTPSPDGIITSSEVRTPRASEVMRNARDFRSAESSEEDITSPEDWATPREEVGFDGAAGAFWRG